MGEELNRAMGWPAGSRVTTLREIVWRGAGRAKEGGYQEFPAAGTADRQAIEEERARRLGYRSRAVFDLGGRGGTLGGL
jgi:hypothetical protein